MQDKYSHIKMAEYFLSESEKELEECNEILEDLEKKLKERDKPSEEWNGEL